MTTLDRPDEPSSSSENPEQWFAIMQWEMGRVKELEKLIEEKDEAVTRYIAAYGLLKAKLDENNAIIQRLRIMLMGYKN
jgi:hypothetical protein